MSLRLHVFSLYFALGVCLFNSQDSIKTHQQKKYGLALSGGGAKGFAHIGLLKAIDSLGIKVDYITGTSMGGILGGLYAMGYTGEELKTMVYKLNWDRILSNKIPYNKVNIEEKDEYDKYIIEFPVVRGKPVLPNSFIEGQYMGEVLNTLTFPAKHVNDFSKLPIPVQLTSSDIIDGGLIMQKNGSLPLAIRSTLAIPAAFSPVYIDGKLLVDGGLDRNFPVNEVKEMGADFVIGGYTGFRLFTKKEIENPMKMIYQTHAFRSVEDFNKQKEQTDLLIDFVKLLNDITTKDFKKYKEIIKIGEEETKKMMPELVRVAEEQKKLGIAYRHEMIKEVKKPTVEFGFYNEDGSKLDNEAEVKSIRNLLQLQEGKYYDAKTANKAIERVFGTRLYDKVYYTYTDSDRGLMMNIFVKKAKAGRFKLALHYDNEQSVGIIVNYTYRDLLLSKSRLIATVDIAERLKGKLNFQKFLGEKDKFWISTEAKYISSNSNDILFKIIGETNNSNQLFPNYRYSNFTANAGLNYKIASNSAIGFGAEYNLEYLTRQINKVTQATISDYNKNVYRHSNQYVFLKFNQNSFNSRYYSKRGNHLQIGARIYFNDAYSFYNLENGHPELYQFINPENTIYSVPESLIGIYVNENFAFPINKEFSIKLNAFAGQHFSSTKPENIPYLFMNQKFNLGGSEYNNDGMNPEFEGFRQKEFPVNSLAKAGFAVQYHPFKNFYITPSVSVSKISDNLHSFDKDSFNIYGYGLNLGYSSIAGPINFSISKNNFINIWRFYMSIGFKF